MSQAARTIAGIDITSTASTVQLGDASPVGAEAKICTHVVQIVLTDGSLIFQGTLGTPGSGTYVALGYVSVADPGTLVTTGIVSASGIYKVPADGLSDVRIKVNGAGTVAPTILDRPIYG